MTKSSTRLPMAALLTLAVIATPAFAENEMNTPLKQAMFEAEACVNDSDSSRCWRARGHIDLRVYEIHRAQLGRSPSSIADVVRAETRFCVSVGQQPDYFSNTKELCRRAMELMDGGQ